MNVCKLLMQYQSALQRVCAGLCISSLAPRLSFFDNFAILFNSIWMIAQVKVENPQRESKFKFQDGKANWQKPLGSSRSILSLIHKWGSPASMKLPQHLAASSSVSSP